MHNAGSDPVDLSGWRFVDGVELTFPPGVVLEPGAYFVVADDVAGFTGYFGQPPSGQWSGELSNGGERIALVDDIGQIVDVVVYTDGSGSPGAWSVDADGNGDSLSLLSAENADGTSVWWDAAPPTPGVANANVGAAYRPGPGLHDDPAAREPSRSSSTPPSSAARTSCSNTRSVTPATWTRS